VSLREIATAYLENAPESWVRFTRVLSTQTLEWGLVESTSTNTTAVAETLLSALLEPRLVRSVSAASDDAIAESKLVERIQRAIRRTSYERYEPDDDGSIIVDVTDLGDDERYPARHARPCPRRS
jgi:hypothetical protein